MQKPRLDVLVLIILMLIGAAVFGIGIGWGLPSRDIDPYLFGSRPVWTGEQILQLAGGWSWERTRGADVDVNPLAVGGQPVEVNATDAQRAAIVLRYRLYSYQPDEMITFRALASMRPRQGDLDPKLYQYGGLWIYPVGGLLKATSLTGGVVLRQDVAYYLDHPEAFGRFYVVARLYAAAWAVVGVWAVFWLARRLADGSVVAGAVAALMYIWLPVVVNMAHEAKPHLPGAVLMLLAVMAAAKYAETGARRWWITTGCLCGAAFGMVLSAWPILVVLPAMMLLRPDTWGRRALRTMAGLGLSVTVYLALNPYLVINAFVNREVLRSNFGNSLAMYELGRWREGLSTAAGLVGEAASVPIAVAGLVAGAAVLAALLRRVMLPGAANQPRIPAAAVLLLVPVVVLLVQFVALAAGKPPEYGRFAAFPAIAMAIGAVALIHQLAQHRAVRVTLFALLIVDAVWAGHVYLRGFIADSGSLPGRSRIQAANILAGLQDRGATRLATPAEPAPYILPPVDLFRWRMLLVPQPQKSLPAEAADVIVFVPERWEWARDYLAAMRPRADYELLTPTAESTISWAAKPFAIMVRKDLRGA